MKSTARVALGLLCLFPGFRAELAAASENYVVLRGTQITELAPHGEGNVYAPEVLKDNGKYRMWYGGQGKDGHDRIHLAESTDLKTWEKKGVVLDRGSANHVNDPTVVKVGTTYFLYYTQADEGVIDEIHVATSKDGVQWEKGGVAVPRGRPGSWDAAIVGRPSVLVEDGSFRMWYDGRDKGDRSVGHAVSQDGIHWTKSPQEPVFGRGAGAVDVKRVTALSTTSYVMLYESREGTCLAVSSDGLQWQDRGTWMNKSNDPSETYGHVTPFLFLHDDGSNVLFYGAASRTTWDGNAISSRLIDAEHPAWTK
ncbi:MAG: hypothetical protein U1D30_07170 [Planctomycetota bacterium]